MIIRATQEHPKKFEPPYLFDQKLVTEGMCVADLQNEIRQTLVGITSYIEATATPARKDRLWPANSELFATNPMSLAHGAAGTALFLQRQGRGVRPATVDWLQRQPLNHEDYPPGFWMGLAGIAYGLSELGMAAKAEQALSSCYKSPLRYREASVFHGSAGWGLVSLYFFEKTQREEYLDQALEAAHWLLRTAVANEHGCTWTRGNGEDIKLGFGYGASGISLFLLMAGRVTGENRLIDCARSAFEFDFAHRQQGAHGWTWPAHIGSHIVLPYWGSGAAGIGGIALRLYGQLGDGRYLEIAKTIADATYLKWTIQPGLLSGLTGIAEFMLDCHVATGHTEYLERSYDIAKTLLLYRIPRPDGVAYPDRWLLRISNDVAAGSAGVGLCFQRLLQPGRNPLVDFATRAPVHAIEQAVLQ